jgi:hypothetical protein
MERVLIESIYKNSEIYNNKHITIAGWVRSIRDSKVLVLLTLMTEVVLKVYR